jgi:hypothetical protein
MKSKGIYKIFRLPLYFISVLAITVIMSCNSVILSTPTNITSTSPINTLTTNKPETSIPETATSTPTESLPPPPTSTPPLTPISTVESLKAMVIADLLSCRYGPGSEYLFLYGLRKGANIKLIGRTEGNNWVYVEGKNRCWVNKEYINIAGDMNSLPIVYPGIAKLPISPYYPPTTVLKVMRIKNLVTVKWLDIPLRAGDEEDASMQHYIIEVWRCEGGNVIFDPLATNDLSITFTDEPGCNEPSHGRIFVQEKHGFAGPAAIPWPPFP